MYAACGIESAFFRSLLSALPWCFGPDDRIEDAQEATHAGDECDLLGAPAFDQALVMLADDGVPADSGEGGHIEGITNVGSPTGDRASTTHLPGIAVDRRDPDESGDTAPIELTEFGQIGNQDERGDVADAWHGGEQIISSPPGRRAFHGVVDFTVQLGELSFQGLQGRFDGALNARIASLMEPVRFHADHLDHLAAARDQLRQGLAVGVGERTRFGTDPFGEQGDDLGIQRIRLGQPAGGTSEVADLAWVDDGERQAGAGESGRDGELEAAGRLEHDQSRGQATQIADQLLETLAITCDREGLPRWAEMNIKAILRDFNADEARRGGRLFHDPSLRMRARLAALATVRVPYGTGGQGTLLFLGLTHPGGLRAPVHREAYRLLRNRQWQDTRGALSQSAGPPPQPSLPAVRHAVIARLNAHLFTSPICPRRKHQFRPQPCA